MIAEHIYPYRMEYPALYAKQFHYPLAPTTHYASPLVFDSVPLPAVSSTTTTTTTAPTLLSAHRSAFSAVKSSAPTASHQHPHPHHHHPYSSVELLQQFYAQQHKAYYSGYFSAQPAASTTSDIRRPTQHPVNMIEQLLRQPLLAASSTTGTSLGSASEASSSSRSDTSSTESDEPEINISDDTDGEEELDDLDDDTDGEEEEEHDEEADDDEVICVDDDEMDRQCRAMIQRTTVIKSVIANDLYLDEQQEAAYAAQRMRGSMQRLSADSSGSDSRMMMLSMSDADIVCQWSECFRRFATLEQLATHVTHTHAIASPAGLYYCQWHHCPRSERGFNARYKMLVHVRTHTKEKPHRCQQCDKSFSRAENLKIHTRSHSGEKPYVCPVAGCTKAYSNSSDRFKHTRTHSTEKPYSCKVPGCNKRYTDPSSLRKHVKTFKHSAHLQTFEEMVKPYRMQQHTTMPSMTAGGALSTSPVMSLSPAGSSCGSYSSSSSSGSSTLSPFRLGSGEMIDLSPPETLRYEPLHPIGDRRRQPEAQQQQPEQQLSVVPNLEELMLHDAHHLHVTVAEPMVSGSPVAEEQINGSMQFAMDTAVNYEMPLDLSMSSIGSSINFNSSVAV